LASERQRLAFEVDKWTTRLDDQRDFLGQLAGIKSCAAAYQREAILQKIKHAETNAQAYATLLRLVEADLQRINSLLRAFHNVARLQSGKRWRAGNISKLLN
jgi:hypothetical protein